jgi:Bacterial Ig-like domain (group 2).
MKRFFQRIAILLCIILVAPTVINCIPVLHNVSTAEAASKKAKLYTKSSTIGIESSPEYIGIDNYNYKAKYTYTPADKKLVSIDKYGRLTGKKTGKTNITVKETYKGKTNTVGTYKVTVAYAKLASQQPDLVQYAPTQPNIQYQNLKATYTYVSSDTSIIAVTSDGFLIGLKTGNASVTVTEKYKNKTRALGSIKLNVVANTVEDKTVTIGVGASESLYDIISNESLMPNYSWRVNYIFESKDSSIVSVTNETDEWGYTNTKLNGVKVGGPVPITVSVEYDGQKYELGSFKVNVAEIPATNLNLYDTEDSNANLKEKSFSYYIEDKDETQTNLNDFLVKVPANTTTPIIFTSSNPAVIAVDAAGNVKVLTKGKTDITAKCGDYKVIFHMEVTNY